MIEDPDPGKRGRPIHCSLPVAYRGRFTDGSGKRHLVGACEEHVAELERTVPAPGQGEEAGLIIQPCRCLGLTRSLRGQMT